MKNPVKKNMEKFNKPSTHKDRKKEAKKEGFENLRHVVREGQREQDNKIG